MKKSILILLVILSLNMETNAQQENQTKTTMVSSSVNSILLSATDDNPVKDYDYYMKKSKDYRTVGWSTLIGGVVLSGVGLLISANSSASFDDVETGVVIMGIGALSGIVSIPFMIMATVNKHKAQFLLDSKKTSFGMPPNAGKNIPGITMLISIGK